MTDPHGGNCNCEWCIRERNGRVIPESEINPSQSSTKWGPPGRGGYEQDDPGLKFAGTIKEEDLPKGERSSSKLFYTFVAIAIFMILFSIIRASCCAS